MILNPKLDNFVVAFAVALAMAFAID